MKPPATIAELSEWHLRKVVLNTKKAEAYEAAAVKWEATHPEHAPSRHSRSHARASRKIAEWHQAAVDILAQSGLVIGHIQ